MRDARRNGFGIWFVIILISVIACYALAGNMNKTATMPYSELVKNISEEKIEHMVADENTLLIKMKDSAQVYSVQLPSQAAFENDVGEKIVEQSQKGTLLYEVKKPVSSIWNIILPIIAMIVVGVFLVIIMRGQSNKGANFTKSRARLNVDSKHKIGFDSVAGAVEEKEELSEIVDFLKNPKKFIDLGARIPKGVLLVGPPGTGKTLLARAVAGEANAPFFSISGSDFVELYVGVGAARVRDLFEQAKRNKPCIIFVDEIDAVGRKRGAGMGGGHDEREQTLNQLLVEMDGFGVNEGIIMIAATNRPDILDPALLRAGRFDRQVVVDAPDVKGREEILKVHSKKKPLADEVDLGRIAKVTTGYTGADLENVMNEAAIFAARKNKSKIDMADIEDANLKVMMGSEKKSKVVTEKEKKLTAYHEAGHALMSKLLNSKDKVHKISIVPRGRAGGFTMHRPDEGTDYSSKGEMLDDIMTLLGGRIAEKLVLEDISTGASNDIKRATEVARNMVMRYGMSDNIGPVCYDDNEEVFIGRDYGHSKIYSDETAYELDKEVKNIINAQYERGIDLLKSNIQILHNLANALLERETLDEAEFEEIIKKSM